MVLSCFLLLPLAAHAQDMGLGIDCIKGATAPGPGTYYRTGNTYYWADEKKDKNGDKTGDFDAKIFVSTHSIYHMTEAKILGGDYGWRVVVPIMHKDLEVTPPGIDDQKWGIGDITWEPVILAWHTPRFDWLFRSVFKSPNGEYAKNSIKDAANPGGDHWAVMPTFGVNYYLTQARGWSLSVLMTYEKHMKNEHKDITYGDDLVFQYGLSHSITPLIEFGLAGYYSQQLTDDAGDDVTSDKSVHDKVHALGPEINIVMPKLGIIAEAKYLVEFAAEDRSQGQTIFLGFKKPFGGMKKP